jgi:hypothetical protein
MQDIHIHVTHHNFPARRKHMSCSNITCICNTFAVDFQIDGLEIGLHTAEIAVLAERALPWNKQFQK